MYDMNLDSLHLSGSLPAPFKSDSLHSLHVQHNNLTGQLPDNYPLELPHLEDLQVQGNQLQGSVPATWQNWGSLKTVYAPPPLVFYFSRENPMPGRTLQCKCPQLALGKHACCQPGHARAAHHAGALRLCCTAVLCDWVPLQSACPCLQERGLHEVACSSTQPPAAGLSVGTPA